MSDLTSSSEAVSGFYSSEENQLSCSPCPPGTHFSDERGWPIPCIPCSPGQFSLGATDRCVACPPGTFSGRGWSTCLSCPSLLTCSSGLLVISPGLWMNPATMSSALPHGPWASSLSQEIRISCRRELSNGVNICIDTPAPTCVAEALNKTMRRYTTPQPITAVSGVDIAGISSSAQFLPCPNPSSCSSVCGNTIPVCVRGHMG